MNTTELSWSHSRFERGISDIKRRDSDCENVFPIWWFLLLCTSKAGKVICLITVQRSDRGRMSWIPYIWTQIDCTSGFVLYAPRAGTAQRVALVAPVRGHLGQCGLNSYPKPKTQNLPRSTPPSSYPKPKTAQCMIYKMAYYNTSPNLVLKRSGMKVTA